MNGRQSKDKIKPHTYRSRLFVVAVVILIGISLTVALLENGAITGLMLAAVIALPIATVIT
jgi:hypothetical protein